jgi:hypothetical protein
MAYLSGFQYCGFAVTPVLGAVLSYFFGRKGVVPKAGEDIGDAM